MAYTIPEALKMIDETRGASLMTAMMLKTVVTEDALFARIPFIETNALGAVLPREGAEPTGGAFMADDDSTAVEESTGTDDVITVPLRHIVGDVKVGRLTQDFSDGQAVQHQLEKKIKAIGRVIANKLVNGAHTTSHALGTGAAASLGAVTAITRYSPWLDSGRRGPGSLKYVHATTSWYFRAPGDVDYGAAVPAVADGSFTLKSHNPSYFITCTIDVSVAAANAESPITFASSSLEFDGLKKIITPAQTIDPVGVDGDLFTFDMLDEMIDNLKVVANPAFFMNATWIRLYYALQRSLGGATPETVQLAGYGRPVPAYRGIPILKDDFIVAADETVGANSTSSLYLASLDADEGLAFLAANRGQRFDPMTDPRREPVLGWRVTDLGDLEGSNHVKARVMWSGAPVLKSPLAAVRRRGVRGAIA